MPTTATRGFNLVIRPVSGPDDGLDVTDAVIDAVASRLQQVHRGSPVLDRLEAEVLLEQAMSGTWSTR